MTGTYRAAIAVFTSVRLLSLVMDVPVVAAADASSPSTYTDALPASDFLAETNAQRIANGVAPLVLNDTLTAAAEAKAADMVEKGYWDHFRPSDGKRPWDFISEAGYQYGVAGENLARGYRTTQGITDAWMASPTHAANILSSKYTEVGFACIRMVDASGKTQLITVQMFATPK